MTKIYSALDIAKWFINRSYLDEKLYPDDAQPLTNMKLQKLLYYAQSMSLAVFNRKLFKEEVEAWIHGPVVDNVYKVYKVCGASPINEEEPVCFDKDIEILLEYIYEKFGIYTPLQLRSLTHSENPYKKTFVDGEYHIKINDELLKSNFEDLYLKDVDIHDDIKAKEYSAMAETSYINSIPEIIETINNANEDKVEVNWEEWGS